MLLKKLNLEGLKVKILNFPANVEISLGTVRVKMLHVFVRHETSFVGRFSFLPDRDRKHKRRDRYLATALRESQLCHFGGPAVALVSAWQSNSSPEGSELS